MGSNCYVPKLACTKKTKQHYVTTKVVVDLDWLMTVLSLSRTTSAIGLFRAIL